jgi:hypothetical protein
MQRPSPQLLVPWAQPQPLPVKTSLRLEAHWPLVVQACPLGRKPLQTPVAALQPFAHCVRIRVPFSQREAVLPWQVDAAPSHSMQSDPSVEQKAPLQPCAQQMLPPETLPAQNPDAQSPVCEQVAPKRNRQLPATSSRSAGHTQLPSAPQRRSAAAQVGSQQRRVLVTSSAQSPDWHWAASSHKEPVGRAGLQRPVAASQPFPQGCEANVFPAQVRELLP